MDTNRLHPSASRPRTDSGARASSAPGARSNPVWRCATVLLALAFACSDSPAEPEPRPDDWLEASASGDRSFDYEGSARFSVDQESSMFALESEGRDEFEGAAIAFVANFEGIPEEGSYTLGPPEEDADVSAALRTFTAIFQATGGSIEVRSVTEERVEGIFTYSATRTHVCGPTSGNCQPLPGTDEIQVEGEFSATAGPAGPGT